MNAKRIGEAAVPGPTVAHVLGTPADPPPECAAGQQSASGSNDTSHAVFNIAAILAIKKNNWPNWMPFTLLPADSETLRSKQFRKGSTKSVSAMHRLTTPTSKALG